MMNVAITLLTLFVTDPNAVLRRVPYPHCEVLQKDLETEYPESWDARLRTCRVLAWRAHAEGLPGDLVVSVGWAESRFEENLINPRSGCVGPLQANSRWWCPYGIPLGCDHVHAGLLSLRHYLGTYRDTATALCHFDAGNVCYPRSLRYARYIIGRERTLTSRVYRRYGRQVALEE